jgi:hypothetical protein
LKTVFNPVVSRKKETKDADWREDLVEMFLKSLPN